MYPDVSEVFVCPLVLLQEEIQKNWLQVFDEVISAVPAQCVSCVCVHVTVCVWKLVVFEFVQIL